MSDLATGQQPATLIGWLKTARSHRDVQPQTPAAHFQPQNKEFTAALASFQNKLNSLSLSFAAFPSQLGEKN